jgi:hypothetical protein
MAGKTRKERAKLQREREKIETITGEGVAIVSPPETKCDHCGESVGTLYKIDGKLVCYKDIPFAWAHGPKAYKLITVAVSGVRSIKAARRRMA